MSSQWIEAAGIPTLECKDDELELDDIPLPEFHNKLAMLSNALYSAQYQLNNLDNSIIDRQTRIIHIQRFVDSAIDLVNDIRKQI